MKLKELHIRNIASIEKADIDFEKGLNDAITGTPASIFLISGDTGAGKSVILDCISMALYKKTPRIEGVANKKENKFENNEGTTIQVNSIEQYTRLGISEKDECYSEVVFEGNDGKNYHARLELGMSKSHTKDEQGIYILKYSTPSWTYKTDEQDWTKDNIEKAILNAVGLTYEQFGRMAMLAQGQFANFLTGDKKEREAILEQLTNTQHFTVYGEAISNLWRKAKEIQTVLQTKYDTEKPHSLTKEEVEQIIKEEKIAEEEKEKYDKEIKSAEKKLKQVEIVLTNEESLTKAQKVIHDLEIIKAGEDYKNKKALVIDWDTTTTQRLQLTNLLKSRQDEAQTKIDLNQTKDQFHLLTADLADKLAKAKTQDETIRQLQEWVNKQARHEDLFTKAGETDLMIGQYLDKKKNASQKSETLKEEKAKSERLKTTETKAKELWKEAKETVEKRQNQIDELSKKRSELNPQLVNDDLQKQNKRKQDLIDLQNAIDNLKPLIEENLNLKEQLQEEEGELKSFWEVYEKADQEWKAKKQDADKASQRLTTMKMSLDDKIKELRHRLYEESTENCPLCGQHIEHIHLDDDFKGMLTPLEKEERQANKILGQAADNRDQAMRKYQQFNGTHENKQQRYKDNEENIAKAQKKNNDKALYLGLDIQKEISKQVTDALESLKLSIAMLEEKQREAEKLQKEINRLIEEKKPFDSMKTEAEKQKNDAENDAKNNKENITRLEKEHADLIKGCNTSQSNISTRLAEYSNNWLEDPEELRNKLKKDAQTFIDNRDRLVESQTKQKQDKTLIANLTQYCQDILRFCPDWAANTMPTPYSCSNINTEWTNLLSNVNSYVKKLRDCQKVIATTEEALSTYYQNTGKTEQSLAALAGQESQVADARIFVSDIDAQQKSRNDAISEARRQIDTAFKELGISDRMEMPDKQKLEEHKASINELRDEALKKQTQAKNKLEDHQKNSEKLNDIEAKLEKAKLQFARWDRLNAIFGGTRFRTLVQTYILRPLLNNANIYLEQITDRYLLTCSEDNEQLSILVLDRYNKNQVRSVTVLSGGERFMISLALSLALSSLPRPEMNINILFIDEGFGTLDEKSLNSVMSTLEKLQEIAGQTNRRVGIISHREELDERIPVQIHLDKKGEGRSIVEIKNSYF